LEGMESTPGPLLRSRRTGAALIEIVAGIALPVAVLMPSLLRPESRPAD
jgi:hypothetical protein